ncbi:hypothetical protein BLS_005886 [Venturia inaequalis]|uniref:DUF1857-domain-containing protein n=1 Tax=Venturia inaequalis TaxID=5025 RepID=A0A8H3UFP6_VENIN|nr:hypothetical protein BLS_005886 [Venturia inaequalis]KAE9986620.1 hypothetical protein EG328_005229 [Venturia inaequalis]
MVNLTTAYTAPINPPNATPILSRATIFAGLRKKVRRAQDFVPVIISCEVVKVEDNVVTREIVFKDGEGPPGTVKEVCVEFDPTKVDFQQSDGTTISNIISDGPSGEPNDLFLTYSFEWKHPNVEAGSAEAEQVQAKHKKTAKMAVDSTIETIRRMAKEGSL